MAKPLNALDMVGDGHKPCAARLLNIIGKYGESQNHENQAIERNRKVRRKPHTTRTRLLNAIGKYGESHTTREPGY